MSREIILAAIPHRPPFLLIDEVVEQTDERIICRKRFTGEEPFYQGHYPGHPLTPGVLLCEAAIQAGAVLLARHIDHSAGLPVVTRMNDVRFKSMVKPPATVELEVTLTDRVSRAFFLSAKVTCDGRLAVRFDFACTLAEAR